MSSARRTAETQTRPASPGGPGLLMSDVRQHGASGKAVAQGTATGLQVCGPGWAGVVATLAQQLLPSCQSLVALVKCQPGCLVVTCGGQISGSAAAQLEGAPPRSAVRRPGCSWTNCPSRTKKGHVGRRSWARQASGPAVSHPPSQLACGFEPGYCWLDREPPWRKAGG